jgi:hypothetical protein
MSTDTKPAEIINFPKMCCERPTQTINGKPYCPVCDNDKTKRPEDAL